MLLALRFDVSQLQHLSRWRTAQDEECRDALLNRYTKQGPWRSVVNDVEYVGWLKFARRYQRTSNDNYTGVEFAIEYKPGRCKVVPFEQCELVGEEN